MSVLSLSYQESDVTIRNT